jgi:hypothetical protein
MPGLTEPNQTGKRQDLSDYITNIERTATPLFSMLPKDTVNKTTFETQVEDYGDTNDIEGIPSNKDADAFQNMAETRAIVENSVMKMWETPSVDDFSENVNENPAVAGEYTRSVQKALVRLKFRVEKALLSQREAAKQGVGGAKAYRTCSIFGFLKNSDPSGTQVIPERFRTPTAHRYTDTLANLNEDTFAGILQEIFEATNGKGKFMAPVGSSLKKKVSGFSIYQPDRASHTVVRRFNSSDTKTLANVVDILEGDFGTIELLPVTRLNYFAADGSATTAAQRRGSGAILDIEMWGLAFKRKPGHKPLADGGGGPRGIVDTIFGLRCKNPKGNGAILVSA